MRRARCSAHQEFVLCGAAILLCTVLVNGACFPAIFNFGDSQSDTGGIHAAFPSFTPAEYPPYGNTFFQQPQYRYCDGRLLIDFIAQAFGLPFLDPYLQSVTSDFYHGANFATAGATVQQVTYLSPFTFPIQIKQFLEFRKNVLDVRNPKSGTLGRTSTSIKSAASTYSERVHRLPKPEFFKEALYTIWIGGNDFTYGYTRGKSPSEVKEYLPQVVEGIAAGIKTLYWTGARNYVVFDAEPQGCLPYTLTLINHKPEDLDQYGCLPVYNEVARFFNNLLNESLTDLRAELPEANIIYFSTYAIRWHVVENLNKYGFHVLNKACCGVPSEYNFDLRVACGMKQVIDNQTFASATCPEPSDYIVWDGVHTTEAANRLIAEKMFSGDHFYPQFPKFTECAVGPLT